jgi:deazaflavin-dependent oxidoreductase (nitroreductase family)
MAYLKPPWFTRTVFNRIAMATGISDTETLTVTRRKTRQPQRIPVIPIDVGGTRYVVSTRGESDWVKNLRADPNATIGSKGYVAHEIPEQDRQAILTAYRGKAGRAVEGYFRDLPREADHPIFVVTPKG